MGGVGILGAPGSGGFGIGGRTFGTLMATWKPTAGLLGGFGIGGAPGTAKIGTGRDGVIEGKSHTCHFAMKTHDEATPDWPIAP